MDHRVIQLLEDTAARIRDIEARADKRLHQDGNQQRYAELMHEKAEVLASLAARAEPILEGMSPVLAQRVAARLARFSQSAGQALDLDSLFYMSALLYPEEHQPGQPNDLELFIEGLKGEDD